VNRSTEKRTPPVLRTSTADSLSRPVHLVSRIVHKALHSLVQVGKKINKKTLLRFQLASNMFTSRLPDWGDASVGG
jgi:hypothetical protein